MDDATRVEILAGQAGSGKTAAALTDYREILRSGPILQRRRALWLAPTLAAASEIRDRLAGPDALLDPGVMTFAGFASSVVWDAGLRVRVLSRLQRRRILRQVIADAAAGGALTYFGRVAGSTGLLNLVDDAIARLKLRDVSAKALKIVAGKTPRRRELAELYSRYEARLAAAKLLDEEGQFLAARDGLREAKQVATGLELVVVDGFTDFTAVQLAILELLAQRARRVLVTLPGDGERTGRRELFAKTQATCAALKRIGASEIVLAGDAARRRAGDAWPAMGHLERNLFRSYRDVETVSPAVRDSLGRMHIIAASSVHADIDQIARRVKQLLVGGAAPSDVAVVFRSTRDVADRVRQAFDDFGIPTHLDSPRRLAATPLVRSLLGVLRLHAEDWPYRRLLQVVGSGRWAVGSDGGDVDVRTAVEFCVRQAQLPSGRESLLEQVAAWADETEPTMGAAALPWLRRLGELLDELPLRAGITHWISEVERLAVQLGLLEQAKLRGASAPLPSPPLKGEGAGQALADWAALVHGLRSIAQVDAATGRGDREISASELAELIASTVAELSAPEKRDATGRVRVLSAEAARFIRPRHLLIGGLSEQSFPAGARSDRRAGEEGDGEEPQDDLRSEEMLLFYQLVTRPTETLTLSYPALDAKAQMMPASPYLVELQRSFRGVEIPRTVQSLRYQSQHAASPLSRSDLRRSAVLNAQERKRDLLAAMLRSPRYGDLGADILDGIEAVASRGDRRRFAGFEGVFSSDAVQAVLERRYGPEHLWSPSMLETYAVCPFRFFGEHVLKLTPVPELALESDLARRGSLLHDTLARLYGRLSAAAAEGEAAPTPDAVAERFQETLDAIVAARPRRGLDAVLREIERRQIASWAKQFAQQHQDYAAAWQDLDAPPVPTYFEARFGPKNHRSESADDASLSTEKPFELAVGGETVKFTGQIDRIDVGRVGDTLVFNVIDYKTSARARLNAEGVEAGLQIQLPLYAMAVAELLLADRKASPLSAGYWSILGKGFGVGARSGGPLSIGEIRDGKVQLAASWTELREKLLGRIAEIVTGIRHGWFPVFSQDAHCTQYCSFSMSCRIAHVRSLEKQWSPPEATS